jgi:N-glycosylase/DNA lyase
MEEAHRRAKNESFDSHWFLLAGSTYSRDMQDLRQKLASALRERASNTTFSVTVIMTAARDAIGNQMPITQLIKCEISFTFVAFA